MEESPWLEQYFEKVASSSREGMDAVAYVREHKTRIGFKKARKNVSAFVTIFRNFYLNSIHFTSESVLKSPRAWVLFIHETLHLKQGLIITMSIYGELEAWQLENRVYKRITGQTLRPIMEELLTLPLNMNRANLRRAREIMTEYAGKGYGANFLPLYPIHKEILYWVTRKEPK